MILDLLDKYGSKISVAEDERTSGYSLMITYTLGALSAFFSLVATLMWGHFSTWVQALNYKCYII